VVFNRADTGGNSMMNFLADFRARRVFNGETTNAMTDSQKLLLEYATESSERAFRELVERYVNLVYSTALRLVEGDAHRAEDVTQMVFADLARKARTRWLPPDLMLGGWLHRNTCFVAAKVMRGERRRQSRERRAVEMNALTEAPTNMTELAPVLDEAINCLRSKDRAAIVLRFFEQQDLRGIGETLGMSENAAQKRVRRALDQLRILLKARGVALSATALATLLTAEAITAAPASLAAVVTSSAVAATAGSGLGRCSPEGNNYDQAQNWNCRRHCRGRHHGDGADSNSGACTAAKRRGKTATAIGFARFIPRGPREPRAVFSRAGAE
jgi:RNA polymerase sigma factor (sigma-70 family)